MKKELVKVLVNWFTAAAARRLAGALLDALLAALAGKASPRVLEAVRALVEALADEHHEAADATLRGRFSTGQERWRALKEADEKANEFGALAAHLQGLLPPEDPTIAGPIGDGVPAEPHPERYRPAPPGVKTWTEPEPTTET